MTHAAFFSAAWLFVVALPPALSFSFVSTHKCTGDEPVRVLTAAPHARAARTLTRPPEAQFVLPTTDSLFCCQLLYAWCLAPPRVVSKAVCPALGLVAAYALTTLATTSACSACATAGSVRP